MKPFVQDNPIPVIFMGVQYLFPIYKEANTHQHLLDKFIEETRMNFQMIMYINISIVS